MISRNILVLLTGFFVLTFFYTLLPTAFGQTAGEVQENPSDQTVSEARTKTTVVADVNIGDIALVERSDGVSGSFQMLGKMGEQHDIVYGIVALDESGALVDIHPLGQELSLKEGERKQLSFEYTYPDFLSGSVTLWLKADTRSGLALGMQQVLTKSFSARDKVLVCGEDADAAGVVTCRHTKGGESLLMLYRGSVLGTPKEEKKITVAPGEVIRVGALAQPGQYTAVVRDAATRELTTFPFTQAGVFGVIESVLFAAGEENQANGVVVASASPSKGASIEIVFSAATPSCPPIQSSFEGRVKELTVKQECLAGSVTTRLKGADGTLLDAVEATYAVERVPSQNALETPTTSSSVLPSETQKEMGTPWYRWLLYGFFVLLIGLVALWRSKSIARRVSKQTTALIWAGLLLVGWTWQTQSASALTLVTETYGPNGCGACNVAFSTSATVTTNKSSYTPGETITLTSNIQLMDAGDNGIGATERARTSVARRSPATFDASDFPSGVVLSSIPNTSRSSLPRNAGPNTSNVTAPAATGPHYLRLRLIITSETSTGSFIDYSETLGNLSFSVDTPVNCTYLAPSFGWGAGTNNVVGSDCVATINNPPSVPPGDTMTFTDSNSSGNGYTGSITLSCNAGPSDISLVSSTCTNTPPSVSGSCGSAHGQTYALTDPAILESARCSAGTYDAARWNPDGGAWYTTSTFPAGAAPYNTGGAQAAYYLGRFWSCDGINGGTTTGCRLYYEPECGSLDGSGPLSSAPGNSTALEKRALCNIGTASAISTSAAAYSWSCTNGAGPTASCSASRTVAGTPPTASITSSGPVALGEPSLWERMVSWVTGTDHVALATHQNATITAGQNAKIDWSSTNTVASDCSVSGGSGAFLYNQTNTNSGSHQFNNMTVGTYTYTILCINVNGSSSHSTTITVNSTGPGVPGCPGCGGAGDFINATPGACGTGTISVDWNNESGSTYYEIERDGGAPISTGGSSSYTHSGLAAGSSHSYRARACNTSGCSGWSNATAPVQAPGACGGGPYTITATASTGCSISPSGARLVASGANQSYTMTAVSGYTLDTVEIDSIPMGATPSFTFSNVTSDHTIRANCSAACVPTAPNCGDSICSYTQCWTGCAWQTGTQICALPCANGIDDDGDGETDRDDPGCHTDLNPANDGTFESDNDENDGLQVMGEPAIQNVSASTSRTLQYRVVPEPSSAWASWSKACRLLDYNSNVLYDWAVVPPGNPSQPTYSITTPASDGVYQYTLECRNTNYPARVGSGAISLIIGTPVATGIIGPVTNCEIPDNGNSCTGFISWQTANVVSTRLQVSGATPNTINALTGVNEGFFLDHVGSYNISLLDTSGGCCTYPTLATSTIQATCRPGSGWVSGRCQPGPRITALTINGSAGSYAATPGQSLTIAWTTQGTTGSTVCIPGGLWSSSGNKNRSGGSYPDTAVIPGTYSLTCSTPGFPDATASVDLTLGCAASTGPWSACGPPCAGGNGTRSRSVTTAACVVTTETESCTTTVCRDLNWREVGQ